MEKLSIGKMAKLNHISEQTLRLYDKLDLIKPDETNSENGYRYYSIRQCARLDMIQYMKSLGMKLTDIKKLLDQNDISLFKSILERKSNQIDLQIKEMQYQKRALQRTIESYERYEKSPPDGSIVMEFINKRQMYCIDAGINFYEHGIEVYEEMLRKLKNKLISDSLPQIYFCNAGTIMRKKKKKKKRLYSSEVFVFVDEEYVDKNLITYIPADTYACIYCDSFSKEKEYLSRILDTVEQKKFIITGDYLCEVIADLPVFEKQERGMYLKLQIPVKFSGES